MDAVIDWETILGLRELQEPGKPDIVNELLQMFVNDSSMSLTSCERAVCAGEAAMLAQGAHRLRGGASLIGATRLVDAARALETVAQEGRRDEWPAYLATMATELRHVHEAVMTATFHAE